MFKHHHNFNTTTHFNSVNMMTYQGGRASLETHRCQGKAQLEFREFSNEPNFYEHRVTIVGNEKRLLVLSFFFTLFNLFKELN